MKKIQHYLTRYGEHFAIESDAKVLKEWESKKHDKYDVLTMKIYPKDLHITSLNRHKSETANENTEIQRNKRGKIAKFSFHSLKRFRFILRNCIDQMTFECGLTYPNEFPHDGAIVKNHFHILRQRLNYYGYKYIWVLEFQERGAPHLHVLLNKEIPEEKLKQIWFDIVGSGDEKHLQWGVHVAPVRTQQGMMHYFASYLEKAEQKSVPVEFENVGRFWGYSRSLLPCLLKKFYGNPEDIQYMLKELRILRRWQNAQKRQWSKKRAFKGKPKFKNRYVRKGSSMKIFNSDAVIEYMKNNGMDSSMFEG